MNTEQNLLAQLKKLLTKDERMVAKDGQILKNKAQELARGNDVELLKLLLSDKQIKNIFFFEIEGALIFDKEKFIRFVSNKQFLPDSYTAYKQKIGLVDENGRYFSEIPWNEVVLAWPFKDCVLEGGMTKEDQKRDEIFYNETLAPDDIDRLLDSKVFTNFKRIDKKGEHPLDGFKREKGTIKDNLIIKGNNLLVLASLKKQFAGKVKLIYIDPPYNTENGSFRYNDSFNHSSWLVFMKNRLEVAKQLLRDDGLIFVQCDDNEQAYLKVLMDGLFGRENFINSIIWKRTFSHGDSGQGANHLGRLHDVILLYKKTDQGKLKNIYTEYSEEYIRNFYKYTDEYGRKYRLVTMTGPGGASKGNPFYEVLGVKRYWMYSKKNMEKLIKNGEVIQTNPGTVPQRRRYLDKSYGVPLQDLWIDINPLQGVQKEKVEFIGQKPEKLLQRILDVSTNAGDVVLDYHAGTGTTLAVAHKLGRQYIGVEQMDYIHELPEARLKQVIKGDQSGISKDVKWRGGGDFVYMELAKWNENWAEKIQDAKTSKELLKLWGEMKTKAFLSYKVDPKTIDTNAKEFSDLSADNQKRFLMECLDKNQLYVNYSEIDDVDYDVSNGDKKINREFYEDKSNL